MNRTSDTHYASIEDVAARFRDEINAIPGLTLHEQTIASYADNFARVIWRNMRGSVPRISSSLDLQKKIEAVRQGLPDMAPSAAEIFALFDRFPQTMVLSAETIIGKIEENVALIFDLKDPLLPPERRPAIRTRRDAFLCLPHAIDTLGLSSLTVDAYRRYAELVKNRRLRHESYEGRDGRSRHSILRMPVPILRERLQAYDERVARSAPARTVPVTSQTPEGRSELAKMIYARQQARRAKQAEGPA